MRDNHRRCPPGCQGERVQVGRLLECVDAGIIPIVAGFQGVSEKGAVTTLGRGKRYNSGSLGVVLKAERVEIFTDVDGIKTADPSLIPDAPPCRLCRIAK